MAKGQKSSATSATRKKHARKAAGGAEQALPLPKEKKPKDKSGKGKGQKDKEPRVKMYIPPAKPTPVRLDPLDTLGLAKQLPPELLVVLRKLAKKDAVTKRKAVEDLRDGWVDRVLKGGNAEEGGMRKSSLETAVPVWLHHLPTLLLHASRQIRASAAALHSSLLRIESLRAQIQDFVEENGEASQVELVIGSWALSAHDVDRQTSTSARRAWQIAFPTSTSPPSLDIPPPFVAPILHLTRNALFDPLALYLELNPVQVAFVPSSLPHLQARGKSGGAKRGTPPPTKPPPSESEEAYPKVDDEEENEDDRKARLRVGALGVLKCIIELPHTTAPPLLLDLLSSPLTWTSLYYGHSAPFIPISPEHSIDPLGVRQPIVRRAAWSMLLSLLKCRKDDVGKFSPTLSSAILRSAWVEPDSLVREVMWEPLLIFLRQNPNAWELDLKNQQANALSNSGHPDTQRGDEHSDDSDSDDEEDNSSNEDSVVHEEASKVATDSLHSQAYAEFLQFLQLGCSGSPVQGYPTIVIILSTIPPSILGNNPEDWEVLFTSFWAALDGRALSSLDRLASGAAFVSSLLECTVFLLKRSIASLKMELKDDETLVFKDAMKKASSEQMKHAWEEIVSGKLLVGSDAAGRAIARTLESLESIDEGFFEAAWASISSSLTIPSQQESSQFRSLGTQFALLRAIKGNTKGDTRVAQAIQLSARQMTNALLQQCSDCFGSMGGNPPEQQGPILDVLGLLKELIDKLGSLIFSDENLSKQLDQLLQSNIPSILFLTCGPALILSHLASRDSQIVSSDIWHSVLRTLKTKPDALSTVLPVLLEGAEKGTLPTYLHPGEDDLSGPVGQLIGLFLDNSKTDRTKLDIVKRIFEYPSYFLSRQMSISLIHKLFYGFRGKSRQLVCPGVHNVQTPPDRQLASLVAPLDLILNTSKAHPDMMQASDMRSFLSDIFVFAFVLGRDASVKASGTESFARARQIWELGLESIQPEDTETLREDIKKVLRELILDVDCCVSPSLILESLSKGFPNYSYDMLRDLFPSESLLEEMLQDMPADPIHPALVLVDPLVPPQSLWGESSISPSIVSYDAVGRSEYCRVVGALLDVVSEDRYLARENMWLLRHFLALRSAAVDCLMFPSEPSHFFRKSTSEALLKETIERVETLTAFLLSDVGEGGWHRSVVASLAQSTSSSYSDPIANFIHSLLDKARVHDTVQNTRSLYTTLRHVLSDADRNDAEQWMSLARRIERQAPQASMAFVLAITESGLEPPSLDRYRNEQAAGILSIPPSKANSDGLALLRRLAVAAPDPESDVIFLPQNRVVNFMKACQNWLSSDEDIDEDAESEMTGVFVHLAPILQNVPGNHWELIFDVIENNLENISSLESSSLPILARTLKLLLTIQDLTKTNKTLREDWKGRELAILKLVRDFVQNASPKGSSVLADESDIVTSSKSHPSVSIPRQICWEMAFNIVRDLPPSLVDHNTLSNLVHLVLDPSPELAKMAYSLLQSAAAKRTEYLVVEAGVDASEEAKFELPKGLLLILQQTLQTEDIQLESSHNVLSYLLSWMLVFDLFNGASLRVKMGYASQLREMELISTNFLPNILGLLNIYGGRGKPFPLEFWKVDEYYVQLYDSQSELSPILNAAHLYYRALLNVPSLIASWWNDCKDRQLSSAVAALTTKYYSPVLIAAELGYVKDHAGAEELTGEDWNIKVSTGTGEVTASYTVDEQKMEIAVRLPQDYPLHSIEVRDIHRLGVDEKKWRGWLLAVQQVVTSQNGRIIDGLSIFKKNVTHHFENQSECAICYSIISVMDLSLPKKRCKTCRNKFHAGCLFKWFNTSHTSSCPLCRSDFI